MLSSQHLPSGRARGLAALLFLAVSSARPASAVTPAAGETDTVLPKDDASRQAETGPDSNVPAPPAATPPVDAPESPSEGPRTPVDAPESPSEGPRTPVDAPQTPVDAPPPVAFPGGEAPHGDVESEGPTRDEYGTPPYDGAPHYDDSRLVTPASKRIWDVTVGLSYSWLTEQLILGPVASFGQQGFWLDVGMPPIFTLKSAPELEGNYLGQRFELAAGYAPLNDMKWRARLMVGADLYALWGIDSEETKAALALKADVTYWATKHFGVELGVRGYPLHSDGLSVEEGPGGIDWMPFFFTTTLHLRSPGEHE